MPVMSTNQPKAGFKFSLPIFLLKYIPATMPTTAKPVNVNKNFHSIGLLFILPAKPMIALKAMIIREVATAFFIDSLAEKINVGIIKKPPPTPTKPVNKPTRMPFQIMVFSSVLSLSVIVFGVFPIIENEAVIINTANTSIMKRSLVTVKLEI